jgi:hypothetical protein
MRYSFNINKLIDLILANMFHKPVHLAWLRAALKPLRTTYAILMAYRTAKLSEATITSSVNRFTKALNDRFDTTDIYLIHQLDYIDNAFEFLETDYHFNDYDYLGEENHVPQDFDYTSNEYDPDNDFLVRIPHALFPKINEIKAFVLRYTMAGRRFTIELY